MFGSSARACTHGSNGSNDAKLRIVWYNILMTKADLPEKLSYHLVFEPEPEGGFTVTVPALSGCITYGATYEEALANVREAILLCIEDLSARNEDIPTESHAPIVSIIDLTRAELHG